MRSLNLDTIPTGVSTLTLLTSLDLYYNKIKLFDTEIEKLKPLVNLERLYFRQEGDIEQSAEMIEKLYTALPNCEIFGLD